LKEIIEAKIAGKEVTEFVEEEQPVVDNDRPQGEHKAGTAQADGEGDRQAKPS
jgi:hypothetical protein